MDSVATNDDRLPEDGQAGTQARRDLEATVNGLMALIEDIRGASIILEGLAEMRRLIEAAGEGARTKAITEELRLLWDEPQRAVPSARSPLGDYLTVEQMTNLVRGLVRIIVASNEDKARLVRATAEAECEGGL